MPTWEESVSGRGNPSENALSQEQVWLIQEYQGSPCGYSREVRGRRSRDSHRRP